MTEISVVELNRMGGTDRDRHQLARQIDQFAREDGFLYLSEHGIPDQLIDEMWAVTTAFFDLDPALKDACVPARAESQRGYSRLGSEYHAHSLGQTAPADLFEAYTMGNFGLPDDEYVRAAATTFFPDNIWPDALPEMRAVWERYHTALGALSHRLLAALALALDLPDTWFEPFFSRDVRQVRALRYPSLTDAPAPGQLGIAGHSDFGGVSILNTNGVSGLQIDRERTGDWTDVPHRDGAFIVNFGDLLQRWSNDRWRSTMHRVVRQVGDPIRQSIVHFCSPNHDTVVAALPNTVAADETPRHEPVISGEYIRAKLHSAYGKPLEGVSV